MTSTGGLEQPAAVPVEASALTPGEKDGRKLVDETRRREGMVYGRDESYGEVKKIAERTRENVEGMEEESHEDK